MKARLLSDGDRNILSELGRYRLLTIDQVTRLRLPGATDRKHVGERFAFFEETGIVGRLRRSPYEPFIHWLKPKAASHYGAEFGEAWSRAVLEKAWSPDLHTEQRLRAIDTCIAARLWLERSGGRIDALKLGWQPSDKFASATRLEPSKEVGGEPYIPDALCDFTDGAGEHWTFALEMETGGFHRRTDNFRERLAARVNVMERQTIDRALQRPKGTAARMLFVFPSADMLAGALRTAGREIIAERARRRIYFQALPDLMADFGGEWLLATGERRAPFQKAKA